MTGRLIDQLRYRYHSQPVKSSPPYKYLDTDYGRIRCLDTGGNRHTIINVPDGPNVIEHQLPLIKPLSTDFRVVSFEYPGLGLSYPSAAFDYSFDHGSSLLIQVMDLLHIPRASLVYSCSNGFYAMQAAQDHPDRIHHLFLAQTPSIHSMVNWTSGSIPGFLKIPVIGQISNILLSKKLVSTWYQYALPRDHPEKEQYIHTAHQSLSQGGCFCLSSLVQGLQQDTSTPLQVLNVPATMVWGAMDFTHRKTRKESITEHIPHCEIIAFDRCGHFPELENTRAFVQLVKEKLRYDHKQRNIPES